MGNALVTLLLVTVVMVSALGLVSGSVSAFDTLLDSSKEMQDQTCERVRMAISCAGAAADGDGLSVRVANDGSIPLSGFENWDVIVQYEDASGSGHVLWMPYGGTAPGANEWTLEGIYFDGEAEVVERGLLNPREELVITAELMPAIGAGTTNLVTVSTDRGVSAQYVFEGEEL
jgi:hypothetical protein